METTGFIGLGRMGRPMAANLCSKGFDLVPSRTRLELGVA